MGLDGVELVMEMEARFGVELPDEECSQAYTVADLAALIISKLPRPGQVCRSAQAFYSLRRRLVECLQLRREQVRPEMRLEALLPRRRRALAWLKLRAFDGRVPPLESSESVDRSLLLLKYIVLVTFPVVIAIIWLSTTSWVALAASIVAILLLLLAMAFMRFICSVHVPSHCMTVADLTRVITPIEIPDSPGLRLVAEQRVLKEVRRIIADHFALDIEQVPSDADLVRDLGVD